MIIALTFYLLTTILSGILTGFMISYCITLGDYFTYMIKQKKISELQVSYSKFRLQHRAKLRYNYWVVGQFIVSIISLLLNAGNYPLSGQLLALVALPLLLTAHTLTGFIKIEEKMFSGAQLSTAEIRNFARYNLPLHRLYALAYGTATIWLTLGIVR